MLKYFSKRLLQLIPVILGVTLLVFMIMQLASGDPARLILGELATQEQVDELREEMGLNDPVLIQYGRYIFNCLKGDFGTSYIKSRSVTAEVLSQFPNTMKLAVVSLILTVILSVPLGIWASIKQNSPLDSGIMVFSLIGISMPVFWLGLLLMIIFSLQLNLLPPSYDGTFASYILPAVCLVFPNMSTVTRTTRSSMLETIRQDYVRTARAKGCTKKHSFYISLGYAEYPRSGSNHSQLMRCADAALYEIKLHGKNGCMAYREGLQSGVRKQLGFALKDVSEHLPGAFIIYKADKKDDELLYANREFLHMTGYKNLEEFFSHTKKSFRNLIREDEQKQMESSIWKQIDGGNENDYIYFHMRKSDGSYISVLDHGRIVETPQYGRVFYVMFIDLEDIHIHYSDLII